MRRRIMRNAPARKESHIPEVPWVKCQRMRWDAILDRLPEERDTTAVEIGVLYGATSARLLRKRPLLTLIMVDPWAEPAHDSDYFLSGDTNATKTQADHERAYNVARGAVEFAGPRAVIHRGFSAEVAGSVKNQSLDLVFIDGDHSFNGVKSDIEAWAAKVKPGGYIGGHDYDHPLLPGVKQAVDCFFKPEAIELDDNRTWFVRM